MKLLKIFVAVLTNSLFGCAIVIAGVILYGNWQLMYVHWMIHQYGYQDEINVNNIGVENAKPSNITPSLFPLHDFAPYWIYGMLSGYGVYFLIGLFFKCYYYNLQRDRANEWKCQPQKWLSDEQERDEIKNGVKALFVANTLSAFVVCYVSNRGYYCTTYYKWDEYSIRWLIFQIPVLFVFEDYLLYWLHRIFHWPTLYRLFHSVHHKYRQPTAFSVTALHPVEIISLQVPLFTPLFSPIPIYWPVFHLIAIYFYVHGILNHSGIDFKAQWWQPWQPDTIFHDNHHQYFHVNFGFNTQIWDWLHGTLRKTDRIYREDIFWGEGKAIQEATREELEEDLRERKAENRKAYRGELNPYLDTKAYRVYFSKLTEQMAACKPYLTSLYTIGRVQWFKTEYLPSPKNK